MLSLSWFGHQSQFLVPSPAICLSAPPANGHAPSEVVVSTEYTLCFETRRGLDPVRTMLAAVIAASHSVKEYTTSCISPEARSERGICSDLWWELPSAALNFWWSIRRGQPG